MPKILTGEVVSVKMQKAAVVEVTTIRLHPIYKKRIKKDKRIKVATLGINVQEGDRVKIIQSRPISREIHFRMLEVIKK